MRLAQAILGLLLLLLGLWLAIPSGADPYIETRTGTTWWGDTSNHDPLESGTEVGNSSGLAIGDELGLSDFGLPKSDFALDAEIEADGRFERLHGRNHGDEHSSADGSDLAIASLGLNFWPGWQLGREWTVYAGAGAGFAWAFALGGSDSAPWWQVGTGIRWNATPKLSFNVGARYYWLYPVKLDGYRATYDGVPSAFTGIRWEFKGP